MKVVPLRLRPGDDLRLAGQPESTTMGGDLEILSLAGTLSPDGVHLHVAVADTKGAVIGTHLTSAESRIQQPATPSCRSSSGAGVSGDSRRSTCRNTSQAT